jgi:hypothetical protein
MRKGAQIFVSYDTREKEWAGFVKDILEKRFPGLVTFVAIRDLKPGDPSIEKMLKALRSARAVIPICSHLSRTSPWLWWEAASGWARKRSVFPLFLGIGGNEFAGPLTLVAQGRPFDVAGVNDLLDEVRDLVTPAAKRRRLTPTERNRLAKLARDKARGPLQITADGPSLFQAGPDYQLCRVRVSNGGSATVQDVQVMMRSFTPQGATFLPVRMQRMHSTTTGYPHPFALDSGAEAYIDVVQWRPSLNLFALCYDSQQLPNGVGVGSYEIELTVSATNLALVPATFVAELDQSQILTLKAKP